MAPALEAGLDFVDVAAAMLTEDDFMVSPWWLGGSVDICTLLLLQVPAFGLTAQGCGVR